MNQSKYRFSIIMPVLHEERRINDALRHFDALQRNDNYEIIVVDGDLHGSTIKAIKTHHDVKIIFSATGRGRQMNAGAAMAMGEILVFLHVDTMLPPEAFKKIQAVLEQKQVVGGAFNLGIKSDRLAYKMIALTASLRSRLTRIPYGDQAIFIRKSFFQKINGYRDIPLMEDIEIMQRIKKMGGKIGFIGDRVLTSPRRWEKEGMIYGTLRNWMISSLYYLGVSPNKLLKFYRNNSEKNKR